MKMMNKKIINRSNKIAYRFREPRAIKIDSFHTEPLLKGFRIGFRSILSRTYFTNTLYTILRFPRTDPSTRAYTKHPEPAAINKLSSMFLSSLSSSGKLYFAERQLFCCALCAQCFTWLFIISLLWGVCWTLFAWGPNRKTRDPTLYNFRTAKIKSEQIKGRRVSVKEDLSSV